MAHSRSGSKGALISETGGKFSIAWECCWDDGLLSERSHPFLPSRKPESLSFPFVKSPPSNMADSAL